VLLASLALNLFLVGLIGGQVFSGDEEQAQRPSGPRGYSLHPRVMREALPTERHDDIAAFAAQARQGMRGEWRGIGDIRRDVDAALRAEPFDPDALRAAQQREVEARATMRTTYNDKTSAFVATLTDEEREKIADVAMTRMEAQREYWRERRRQREAAEKSE